MNTSFVSPSLRPPGANKTGFNLLIFHFNIRGKLSIIRCDEYILFCISLGGYPAPPPPQTYSLQHLPRHLQPPANYVGALPPSGYPLAAPTAPRMSMAAPAGPPPPPQSALTRQTLPTDLQSLADTIAQATSLIQVH